MKFITLNKTVCLRDSNSQWVVIPDNVARRIVAMSFLIDGKLGGVLFEAGDLTIPFTIDKMTGNFPCSFILTH